MNTSESLDRRSVRAYLLTWLRPQAPRFALAVILGAAAAGSAVALTATSAWLISRAAQHPPVLYLMVAAVAVRSFGISRGVFRYLERIVAHDAALRMLSELRTAVFAAMIPLVPGGLDDIRDADLMNRLVDDVDEIQDAAVRGVIPALAAAVVALAAIGVTAALLPAAAVTLAMALLVGGVGVPLLVDATSRRASSRTAGLRAELACQVVDLVEGSAELLAYDADESLLTRMSATSAELAAVDRRQAGSLALGVAVTTLAAGGALWSAFVVGIPAVRAGALSGLLLAVIALGSWAALDIVTDLPGVGVHLRRGLDAAGRLMAITDRALPVAEPTHCDGTEVAKRGDQNVPVVRLRDLTVRRSVDRPIILDGVDLDLRAGTRTVIVGLSGTGKSTLVDTLLRFVDFEGGTYAVGGVDVRQLASNDVRRIVGCCEQQPHLFDSTLRENVRIGDSGAPDSALQQAIAQVGLDGWLSSLPFGLDTRVGANGTAVSGGQARRIALARALLADFPVLLLDEPTEGLDDEAALDLLTDALAATRDRAVLLITHSLLGIEHADVVLEMHDGRLCEADAPLTRQGGQLLRYRTTTTEQRA